MKGAIVVRQGGCTENDPTQQQAQALLGMVDVFHHNLKIANKIPPGPNKFWPVLVSSLEYSKIRFFCRICEADHFKIFIMINIICCSRKWTRIVVWRMNCVG